MQIEGYFEGLSDDGCFFSGWSRDKGATPGDKLSLVVLVDGVAVDTIVASRYRPDLQIAGLADPAVGFIARVPDHLRDGAEHEVAVAVSPSGDYIPGSPRRLALVPVRSAPKEEASVPLAKPNLLPNPDFLSWPHGLIISASADGPIETASGWWLMGAHARATVWHPNESFAAPPPLGLAVTLGSGAQSTACLYTQLNRDQISETINYIALSLISLGGSDVWIDEIAIVPGSVDSPQARLRLACNIRVRARLDIEERIDLIELLSAVHVSNPLFLTIHIRGSGTIAIIAPYIRPYRQPAQPEPAPAIEGFESREIVDQVSLLCLPESWRPRMDAKSAVTLESPLTPFTQIIIPVHNAAEHVVECISSILCCTQSPIQIIIGDDCSNEITVEAISAIGARDPRLSVVRSEENVGYTKTVNHLLSITASDYVVVMNSDAVVTNGWLDKLHQVIRLDPDIAAVGPVSNAATWQSVPLARSADGEWIVNSIPSGMSLKQFAQRVERASEAAFPEVPLLNGFCTLYRRSALQAVGYLAERDFPEGYGEENDLALRLTARNFKLRVADHCYVYHKKSRSFGKARRDNLGAVGGLTLERKHQGINIRRLEQQMASCEALLTLRRRLAETEEPRDAVP